MASEIAAAAQATGAFSLAAGSKDASVLITLAPRAHTAQVAAANAQSGQSRRNLRSTVIGAIPT